MRHLRLGLKLSEIGSGSSILAAILYQTSLGDFVYTTDGSGNVILDNQGSLGSANDGQIYSGRGLELLATNNLSIPIHHTLGAELITDTTIDDVTKVSVVNTTLTQDTTDFISGTKSFRFEWISGAYVLGMYNVGTLVQGNTYLCRIWAKFEGSSTTKEISLATLAGVNQGAVFTLTGNVNGLWKEYEGICTIASGTGAYYFRAWNTGGVVDSTSKIWIDGIATVKQITTPNSYLTYYDFSKSAFVTLGNSVDGGSSANLERIPNPDFDSPATHWVGNNANATMVASGGIGTFTNIADYAYVKLSPDITLPAGTYREVIKVTAYSHTAVGGVHIGLGTSGNNKTAIGTYTRTYVHAGGVVAFQVRPNVAGVGTISFEYMYVKEILPISTTYTLNTKTANNFLTHTTNWSASDWIKINNNPNLVGKLALETLGATKTIPELDMVMDAGASADKWFACMEPSLATVYNARGVDSATITNYAETIRTNADFSSKGIQTTAFVLTAGVPTAYSSNLLQFNGDGRYVDTQIMPPSDKAWEIDFVMECNADGTIKWSGIYPIATSGLLLIGQHNTNKITVYVGSTVKTSALAVSDGLHYIRVEFDGAGNGNVVIDNTETLSYTASNYLYSVTEKFFIGVPSRAGTAYTSPHKKPVATFQYKLGTRTAAERNAYYAQLKTIYPTLA